MEIIQAEKRFQHLSEAEVMAAWARVQGADDLLRSGKLPSEGEFIAQNVGAGRFQEDDGFILAELMRLMTAYTNNIIAFAERSGRMPAATEYFIRARWPIEAVALRTAKENMSAAVGR